MYYISTTVPEIAVFEFEWDDENLDKIAQRVDPEEIDGMLDERFITIRNSRSRTGEYILVGRGKGGAAWAVSIVRTAVNGRWRPINAEPPTGVERAQARKAGIL